MNTDCGYHRIPQLPIQLAQVAQLVPQYSSQSANREPFRDEPRTPHEPGPPHTDGVPRVELRVRDGVDVDGGEAEEGEPGVDFPIAASRWIECTDICPTECWR